MMPATPSTMAAKRIQPWPRSFMVLPPLQRARRRRAAETIVLLAGRYIPDAALNGRGRPSKRPVDTPWAEPKKCYGESLEDAAASDFLMRKRDLRLESTAKEVEGHACV